MIGRSLSHYKVLEQIGRGGMGEVAGNDRYSQPSRDGRRLYFFSNRGEESRNIWMLSLEDGDMRPVTDFYGRRGRMPSDALAVGDDYIYFTWADDTGDLWLMDVVTGDE